MSRDQELWQRAKQVLDEAIAVEPVSGRRFLIALAMGMDRPLTPEYARPEQIRGEPITTASDVIADAQAELGDVATAEARKSDSEERSRLRKEAGTSCSASAETWRKFPIRRSSVRVGFWQTGARIRARRGVYECRAIDTSARDGGTIPALL